MQQTSERNAIGETLAEQTAGRAAATAHILAQGGELDPEGVQLEQAYLAMSAIFAGLSCEGMLKAVSAYVVDQAFSNASTISGGIAASRDFGNFLRAAMLEYAGLKMRTCDVSKFTHEQIAAELNVAISAMSRDPSLGSPRTQKLAELGLALAKAQHADD